MTLMQSMALRSDRQISRTNGQKPQPNQHSAAALSSSVSLTVLAATMAVSAGALLGAPMAHAQAVTNVTLSGSQTTTQTITGGTVVVDTAPGFGIDTAAGRAIDVRGTDGTTFTDANTSAITGFTDGILIRNSYNGALSLTTSGTVTGLDGDGISARNLTSESGYDTPTNLTIVTAAVLGDSDGINARNDGSGVLSITSTGTVTSTRGDGIYASNRGTDLTISAATVSGYDAGINAVNNGSGALSITATGTVTAAGEESYGIDADNKSGTDLTIAAAAVSGIYDGIYAENRGSGKLSITATGAVTGSYYHGIHANNFGGDLTISSAAVTGGETGILVDNRGSGALSITSTGTVTGTTEYGISAVHSDNRKMVAPAGIADSPASTDFTISTVAVSGGRGGIRAGNNGTGALSITSTGAVTGATGRGIFAINGANYRGKAWVNVDSFSYDVDVPSYSRPTPTNLTISSTSVSGGIDGIYALNNGSGALSITTTGTVTGTYGRGIFASNGGTMGRRPYYYGGRVSVAPAAQVRIGYGYTTYAGTNLTISTAAVSGGTDGILAQNFGTGALTITSTGTVTGTSGRGISASNGGLVQYYYGGESGPFLAPANGPGSSYVANAGTDLTVTAAAVSGGTDGIYAQNFGTGALTVTSTGAVTGTSGRGIFASNGGLLENYYSADRRALAVSGPGSSYIANAGTDLTVTAASVSGGTDGIYARNFGSGAISVTTSGAVTGGTGTGIVTQSLAGAAVSITLTPTASVSATSGAAIVDGAGNANVTINTGAAVTGSIALGDGNDTLTFRPGASLAGVTTLDGGAGEFTDTLNLGSGWTGDINSWETVNADTSAGNFTLSGVISDANELNKLGAGNLTLTGISTLTGGTFVRAGRLSVNGSLANSLVTVQSGGTLGGTGTVGSVVVQSGGTFAPGNSIGTIAVAGDLTLSAGSTLAMEISPTTSDLINVTGTATIAGTLAVLPEQGAYFGQTYTLINANSVTGTFATTTLGAPASPAFRPTVLYSATMVRLRLDPNSLVQVGRGALRGNSLAAAAAIDAAVLKGYNPQPFINLYNQPATLQGALGQLAGELHSAERRVALQDTRIVRETAFDRLNAGPAASPGTSAVTSEVGDASKTIWMRAAGSWGTARTDTIGSRFTTDQVSILAGVDWAKDGFRIGGMFSYITTNLDLLTLGRSRVESIGGAIYTGYRQPGSGFSVGLGVALASNTARGNRTISIPGLTQTLRSNVNGMSYQIFAEGAYDLAKAENLRVEPFARIAYAGLESKAFTETGGIAALSGRSQKNQLTTATFGMRGGVITGQTTLSGSAGWQRTGGDRSGRTILTMAGVNTPYFVNSAALDRDALAVEAQASVSVSSSFTFSLGYSGVLGRRNSDHGARATARVTF